MPRPVWPVWRTHPGPVIRRPTPATTATAWWPSRWVRHPTARPTGASGAWRSAPALEAKIRDVVGLYLDPPAGAIVLSVDEKTQIQALDRTQPMLPMRSGQVERHTHDYTRNGTTCLFAALEVATGQVTTDTRERHTGADFPAFMRRVARAYPEGDLHVVLDNVSTHKTPEVLAWLARHPRIAFHFTPTSASWMNQVETWFGVLTRQAIRRGSFRSVKELVAMIDAFTRQWNEGSSPGATAEFLTDRDATLMSGSRDMDLMGWPDGTGQGWPHRVMVLLDRA